MNWAGESFQKKGDYMTTPLKKAAIAVKKA